MADYTLNSQELMGHFLRKKNACKAITQTSLDFKVFNQLIVYSPTVELHVLN